MDGTILIADDDRTIRTVLTQAFTRAGCKVHATSSLVTLMRWVTEGMGDLVISDVKMPDGDGIETLPKISAARPDLPVIIISAQNTIMTAIKATEAEAFDYLPKPFDLPDLMKRAGRALSRNSSTRKVMPDADATTEDLPLIGKTSAMQEIYRLIARVVNRDINVLITGESGTGKSLIAKVIHEHSDRRAQPFIVGSKDDITGPDSVAQLLQRATSPMGPGTLVLDEVGDLNMDLQGCIVRMLDGLPDTAPRILATSQSNLVEAMDKGRFRQDLFYRLNGVSISVPSLRERIDDIALLVTHFLEMAAGNGASGTGAFYLSDEAQKLMRQYSWPGNLRQLVNSISRLVITCSHEEISLFDVQQVLGDQPKMDPMLSRGQGDKLSASIARHIQRYFDLHGGVLPPPGLYDRILREMEVPLIEIALDATSGNQAKCADLLGINRNTLRKKLTELDIAVSRRRKLM